ncbi:hypothetical protein Tco_1427484 [Tanacetum coccineum]
MSVYIEGKINEDLCFAAGLSHLWGFLYSRVNEHRLLIAELNVFGGPLALQCAEFFKKLSQTEVLKMLEIRKSIAKVHMQVHKKIDFLTVMRSFTLGSTEEADNVKILQSCNGLILCGGSGMPVFDYVYNPSTNQYKNLLLYGSNANTHTNVSLVTSGRKLFEWRTLFLKDKLYDSPSRMLVVRSNVLWSIVLGKREQDSFLVIKLSGKVVQYNLISKTLHEIYDCRSNQVDDNHDDNDDANDDELLQ